MLERLHEFWTKLGIKAAVGDAFVTTVVLIVLNWALAGEPLDVTQLKLAAYMFILAVVGVAAPPSARTVMTRGGVKPRRPLGR